MVIWMIGMSGSGKTALANEMFKILEKYSHNWVCLDGDVIRQQFGEDLGHTLKDRRKNAERITASCKSLEEQGKNVLACVLSVFPDMQRQNRVLFKEYKQIFIDVTFEKLLERDNKNLYQSALNGEINDVVGVDIKFPRPVDSDIVFDNNEDGKNLMEEAFIMIDRLGIPVQYQYQYTSSISLIKPYKYEYTAYEGNRFFDMYDKSREQALAELSGKIKQSFETPVQDLTSEALQTESDGKVHTYGMLKSILSRMENGQCAKQDIRIIKKLQKKFEVFKKIYTFYSADQLLKASEDWKCISNYILLSRCLCHYIKSKTDKYQQAIMFNTLLKLNDLIIAEISLIGTYEDLKLSMMSLKEECQFFVKMKG